jgi:FAD/FMN-containing dehydrogenase/Fe-S oxidoreductase
MTKIESIIDFTDTLSKRIDGEVRTDRYSRLLYSTDASIYQVMPLAVLIPRNIADVQAAMELASQRQIPVLPRTAGSSLVGQAVNEALVIDMTRYLDQVVEINPEEQWVRVQPGIVLDELNQLLQPYDLQFGPDPASSNRAALGGIVSNNSTGAHSILYGMTADHVLETQVILSDGSTARFGPVDPDQLINLRDSGGLETAIYEQVTKLVADPANQQTIYKGTSRHWRRCGGYNLDRLITPGELSFRWPVDDRFNLAKLITGAEGTLAVMTDIKLNLVSRPKKTALAIVHFDDLFTALSAVPAMLEVGPTAVELLDNLGLTMCREVPQYARLLKTFVEGDPNCVLITEFYGESDSELKSKVEKLKRQLKEQNTGAVSVTPAYSPELQQNVWTVRKVGLGLMMSIKGDHKPIPFIEDAAVPPNHLADYVTKLETFCNELGTQVAYYAHASAGCIHIRPLINTKSAKEVAKLPEITTFSVDLLRGFEGSFSSEHGDGRARSWLNQYFYGPELYSLYKEIKKIFDPQNILNPGNIVDAQPMTESLRFGESYQVLPLEPHLDFSNDLGFDRAIEMCNGAGVCRKKTTGTMCPSFMVTREEEHSTRGRANSLRAALSGLLPASEFTSKRMYDVMDLCLECKACKAECPSSVDMAKIKFEFLAHYFDTNGIPMRNRLFGDIHALSDLGSGLLSGVTNWSLNNRAVRAGMERFAGITSQRPLPQFVRETFESWHTKRVPHNHSSGKPVVLLVDSFVNYNEPQIGVAALEVLEAVGFDVIVPPVGEEGRPFISKGLVNKARKAAQSTLERLMPYVEEDMTIVGLEPSGLLSFRDEYLYLLPGDSRVNELADHALTFEEFIAKIAQEGNFNGCFTENRAQVVLHGHCHQKALVGTEPSIQCLSLPANYAVSEVDSGCCGMAGSFGFEVEHYDLSMKMGERRLFPAVREAESEAIIVAAGASCRQQIMHGTGRKALHPAEVLHDALVDSLEA